MSADPTINLNDTTPSAPANGINVKWAASGSDPRSVTAAVVGDGNITHALRGDGTFGPVSSAGVGNFDASKVLQRVTSINLGGFDGASGYTTDLLNVGLNLWILGTSVNYTPASTSNNQGTVRHFTNGSTANLAGMRGADGFFAIGQTCQFVCLSFLQRITDVRMWVGLSGTFSGSTVTQYGGSDDPTSFTSSFIGFRFSTAASDTNWMCVVSNGTTKTVVSSGVAADTKSHYFAAICDDTVPQVKFYIDGTLVATISTNYPTSGVNLEPVVGSAAIASVTGQSFNFGMMQIASSM